MKLFSSCHAAFYTGGKDACSRLFHHFLIYMGEVLQFSVSPRPLVFGFGAKGLGPGIDNNHDVSPAYFTTSCFELMCLVKLLCFDAW